MTIMAPKFESFLIKMVAVEALQDPFLHMFKSESDEENFKVMDVSVVNKVTMRQFKKDCKANMTTVLTMVEAEVGLKSNNDVGQVVRKNPGFDPVFMKV